MLDYVEFLKRFAASHISDEQHEKNGTVPPDVMLRDMINYCLWFPEPKFKIGDEVIYAHLPKDDYMIQGYAVFKNERTGEIVLRYIITDNTFGGAITAPEELLLLKKNKPYYKYDREYGKWIDQRFSNHNQSGWTPSREITISSATTDKPEAKE